jgi:hypothetical protein
MSGLSGFLLTMQKGFRFVFKAKYPLNLITVQISVKEFLGTRTGFSRGFSSTRGP